MDGLPAGTVTFLFTDIEGSTRLLRELGDMYENVLRDERQILRNAATSHGGREIDTQGDAFFFSFVRARDAVAAAVAAQSELASHDWSNGVDVRVRMGLHTGEPTVGEEGYVGLDVVRAARICSAGHGGQILLSETTRALLGNEVPEGVVLRDLGRQDLKDVQQERIFELTLADGPHAFPALKTQRPARPAAAEVLGDEFSARLRTQIMRSVEESLTGRSVADPPPDAVRLTRIGLWTVVALIVGVIATIVVVKLAFF